MFSTVFPSHVFYLRRTFGLNPEWKWSNVTPPIHLLTLTRTQHNFILKLSSLSSKNESIIKTNKQTNKQTPNSPFSYLIVPFLGLNALSTYLPGLLMIKDKPGLTRLTWNTDWAFLEKKSNRHRIRQNKKNQLSAPSVANFWFNKRTHHPHFLLFYNILHEMSHQWYYKTEVIKKSHIFFSSCR